MTASDRNLNQSWRFSALARWLKSLFDDCDSLFRHRPKQRHGHSRKYRSKRFDRFPNQLGFVIQDLEDRRFSRPLQSNRSARSSLKIFDKMHSIRVAKRIRSGGPRRGQTLALVFVPQDASLQACVELFDSAMNLLSSVEHLLPESKPVCKPFRSRLLGPTGLT